MSMLSPESLKQWKSVLPPYLAVIMDEPEAVDSDFLKSATSSIESFETAAQARDFVQNNADHFMKIGRSGRLRFVAYVLSKKFDDIEDFMVAWYADELLEDKGGEEGSGSRAQNSGDPLDRVAPFFYSDLLAYAQAIGPLVASKIVDSPTLEAVAGASMEVIDDYRLKGKV